MSGSIKLKLPAGGSKTILAPDSASDETITLPAGTGGTLVQADSSGKVGIGTSSPIAPLHVAGNMVVETGSPDLYFATSNPNHTNFRLAAQESVSDTFEIASGTKSAGSNAVNDTYTTRFVVNSSGNVGIGVAPASWNTVTALQVGGLGSLYGSPNQSAGTTMEMADNAYYQTGYKRIIADEATRYKQADGTHTFYVAPYAAANSAISWTNAMTIENDGDVFISDSQSNAPWSDSAGDGCIKFQRGGGAYDTCLAMSSNVGANGYSMVYLNQIAGNSGKRWIAFNVSGGQKGSITYNGTGTAYNTSSDYRLKENVVPMTGSIDRLKALKPSRFNFIADADTTVDGFLAHEAQSIVPECVTGEKDAMTTEEYEVTPAVEEVLDTDGNVTTPAIEAVMGEREVPDYQGIDQSKLVPLLVASLQEAVAKIEALETRVTQLENNV